MSNVEFISALAHRDGVVDASPGDESRGDCMLKLDGRVGQASAYAAVQPNSETGPFNSHHDQKSSMQPQNTPRQNIFRGVRELHIRLE